MTVGSFINSSVLGGFCTNRNQRFFVVFVLTETSGSLVLGPADINKLQTSQFVQETENQGYISEPVPCF
jgi:hypothetical protein